MIPMYNTKKFTDFYSNVDAFLQDYKSNGLPTTISDVNATTLFFLLYPKYGNSSISNLDENQFKYRLFSIIFQYGPTWEKRLSIQDRLRNLEEKELMVGAKTIVNNSLNPDSNPTVDELEYINQQNTNKVTKSILGAYAELWSLLKLDVTEEFINRFKQLFIQVVQPQRTYIYKTDDEEKKICQNNYNKYLKLLKIMVLLW